VTHIHDQHHALEALAVAQIAFHERRPFLPDGQRHIGVAITGQIDESHAARKGEEVEQLRSAGRAAGARKRATLRDGIERARFAGVGASGEGHLRQIVGGQLHQLRHALYENRCVVVPHEIDGSS
jgi:hypothetical protein